MKRARGSHNKPQANTIHGAREQAACGNRLQCDERLAPDDLAVAIGHGQLADDGARRKGRNQPLLVKPAFVEILAPRPRGSVT